MSDSEFSDSPRASKAHGTTYTTGIGSHQAQMDSLAGGLSNANVDGTVGPNFFVARLEDEAYALALYGWLNSSDCFLGLQGKVQLPEGVNCALDFLEVFNKQGIHSSFGKIVLKNASYLKPDGLDDDTVWDWDKGFVVSSS